MPTVKNEVTYTLQELLELVSKKFGHPVSINTVNFKAGAHQTLRSMTSGIAFFPADYDTVQGTLDALEIDSITFSYKQK